MSYYIRITPKHLPFKASRRVDDCEDLMGEPDRIEPERSLLCSVPLLELQEFGAACF